jgi:multidrug efflux pump subunit AcrA (membrane-fusion protein)
VVAQVLVELGDAVEEQQPIARLRGPNGTEVLTAPRHGEIVSLPVQVGDTLTPGTTLAVVADLSRLQVETTDVDEFLVGQIRRGQPVTLQIDALERRDLRGRVRTVAPQPQTSATGDEHYPVVIDLEEPAPGLRIGMTARITFGP